MAKTEMVQKAVKFLAGRCDGAATKDGVGFNGADSEFGKSLAAQENWSEKQENAARKMIKKYKGQLISGGFDVEKLFNNSKAKAPTNKKKGKRNLKKGNNRAIINKTGSQMEIWFDFDWDTLALVKTLPGRRFRNNKRGKYWVADVTDEAVTKLKKAGFIIENPDKVKLAETEPIAPLEIKEIDVPNLKKTLFPYQKEGVAFLEKRNGRALLGDEMGLGKTIQALAWLELHPERRPVVIVVPAHLKLNWEQEVKETLSGEPKVEVLYGRKPHAVKGEIIIINYDILNQWVDALIKLKPQVMVFDEAHLIKNSKAQRTKATKKLAKGIPHVIALTGTPIVNRPVEGFNIAQIIDKNIFPNYWKYVHEFCGAKHNGFGWDFNGATNKEKLHKILTSTIMIRRKKANVLPELPAKLYSYTPVEIQNKKEYARAERNFIKYLKGIKGEKEAEKAKRAEHLVKIEALKQLAVKGKMKRSIEWIRDFITSGNGDSKLVVFAVHKKVIDKLMEEFKDVAVKIDGSCSAEERDRAVKAFQNDPETKLFVGNIQAAGTGLTLTAASSVAFLELPWTPGELVQAEDRCHRIGQKDVVNVYYLLAENSIERKIAELLDEKREVLDAILDGKDVTDTPLLTELMGKYNKEVQ